MLDTIPTDIETDTSHDAASLWSKYIDGDGASLVESLLSAVQLSLPGFFGEPTNEPTDHSHARFSGWHMERVGKRILQGNAEFVFDVNEQRAPTGMWVGSGKGKAAETAAQAKKAAAEAAAQVKASILAAKQAQAIEKKAKSDADKASKKDKASATQASKKAAASSIASSPAGTTVSIAAGTTLTKVATPTVLGEDFSALEEAVKYASTKPPEANAPLHQMIADQVVSSIGIDAAIETYHKNVTHLGDMYDAQVNKLDAEKKSANGDPLLAQINTVLAGQIAMGQYLTDKVAKNDIALAGSSLFDAKAKLVWLQNQQETLKSNPTGLSTVELQKHQTKLQDDIGMQELIVQGQEGMKQHPNLAIPEIKATLSGTPTSLYEGAVTEAQTQEDEAYNKYRAATDDPNHKPDTLVKTFDAYQAAADTKVKARRELHIATDPDAKLSYDDAQEFLRSIYAGLKTPLSDTQVASTRETMKLYEQIHGLVPDPDLPKDYKNPGGYTEGEQQMLPTYQDEYGRITDAGRFDPEGGTFQGYDEGVGMPGENKATHFIEDAYSVWAGGIESDTQSAIDDYTGNGYQAINSYLRDGVDNTDVGGAPGNQFDAEYAANDYAESGQEDTDSTYFDDNLSADAYQAFRDDNGYPEEPQYDPTPAYNSENIDKWHKDEAKWVEKHAQAMEEYVQAKRDEYLQEQQDNWVSSAEEQHDETFGAGNLSSGDAQSTVDALDAAFNNDAVAPDNMIVWRSGYLQELGAHSNNVWEHGEILQDLGFVSTSLSKQTANGFSGTLFQIEIPKGAKAAYVSGYTSGSEKEMLLPRGSMFTLMGETADDDSVPRLRYLGNDYDPDNPPTLGAGDKKVLDVNDPYSEWRGMGYTEGQMEAMRINADQGNVGYTGETTIDKAMQSSGLGEWQKKAKNKPKKGTAVGFSKTEVSITQTPKGTSTTPPKSSERFGWTPGDLHKTGKRLQPAPASPQDASTAPRKAATPTASISARASFYKSVESPSIARFFDPTQQRGFHGKWVDEGKGRKPGLDATVVMQKKEGGAEGSNVGGFYKGSDGVSRYVKTYNDATQAYGEVLANDIYQALGVNAPNSSTFDSGGTTLFASDIVPGSTVDDQLGSDYSKKQAQKILEGFAADVLLANWDVLGMAIDNLIETDGEIWRIDNGSAFLHRAQGTRKDTSLLDKPSEWDTFAPGGRNTNYANVFLAAGYDSPEDIPNIDEQLSDIGKLYESMGGDWSGYIEEHVPDMKPADQTTIADMLEQRTKLLVDKRKSSQAVAQFFDKTQTRGFHGRWIDEGKGKVAGGAEGFVKVATHSPATDDGMTEPERRKTLRGRIDAAKKKGLPKGDATRLPPAEAAVWQRVLVELREEVSLHPTAHTKEIGAKEARLDAILAVLYPPAMPTTATDALTTLPTFTGEEAMDAWRARPFLEQKYLVSGVVQEAPYRDSEHVGILGAGYTDQTNIDQGGFTYKAANHNMSVEEYTAAATAHMTELVKKASLVKRTHLSTLLTVLTQTEEYGGGRFKGQFETGTSSGYLGFETRRLTELILFNAPRYGGDEKRPVYGYLTDNPTHRDEEYTFSGLAAYGDTDIVFKDNTGLRERSTFYVGDSLGAQEGDTAEQWPSPMVNPSLRAYEHTDTDVLYVQHIQDFSGPYVEVQVHGGMRIADIDYVILPRNTLVTTGMSDTTAIVAKALDEKGIKWQLEPEDDAEALQRGDLDARKLELDAYKLPFEAAELSFGAAGVIGGEAEAIKAGIMSRLDEIGLHRDEVHEARIESPALFYSPTQLRNKGRFADEGKGRVKGAGRQSGTPSTTPPETSMNYGITSNRGKSYGTVEGTQGYYGSTRYKGWLNDFNAEAKRLHVTLDDIVKAPGIWEGTVEPSASVWAHGDMPNLIALGNSMGAEYNQQSVLIFTAERGDGKGGLHTLPNVGDADKAIAAMKRHGVNGGRVMTMKNGDTALELIDFDGGDEQKIADLAKELGSSVVSTPGTARFLNGGEHYERRTRPHKGSGITHASVAAAMMEQEQLSGK